jgi:hypothetical protein
MRQAVGAVGVRGESGAAVTVVAGAFLARAFVGSIWRWVRLLVETVFVAAKLLLEFLIMAFAISTLLIAFGGVGYGLLPLAATSDAAFKSFTTSAAIAQATLNPVLLDLRTVVQCTVKPLVLLWNLFIRIPLGTIRAAIIIATQCNVAQTNPNAGDFCSVTAFQWATRGQRAARTYDELDHARAREERLAAHTQRMRDEHEGEGMDTSQVPPVPSVPRTGPVDARDWHDLGNKTRLAYERLPQDRDIFDDIFNVFCKAIKGATDIAIALLNLYTTYHTAFLQFILAHFSLAHGFDTSYLVLIVEWLVQELVKEFILFQCLIDVSVFKIDDLSTYVPQPWFMAECVCAQSYLGPFSGGVPGLPHAPFVVPAAPWLQCPPILPIPCQATNTGGSPTCLPRQRAPHNVAAAALGCVCPLNGSTDVLTILWNCAGMQCVLDQLNAAWQFFFQTLQPLMDALASATSLAQKGIDFLLSEKNRLDQDIKHVRALFGKSVSPDAALAGLRAYNATDRAARRDNARVLAASSRLPRSLPVQAATMSAASEPAPEPESVPAPFKFVNPAEHTTTDTRSVQSKIDELAASATFMPMTDRIARDLGADAGEQARLVQEGVACALTSMRRALAGEFTIDEFVDQLLTPCVLNIRHVLPLHAAMRAKEGYVAAPGVERAATAVNVAAEALFRPAAFAGAVRRLERQASNRTEFRAGLVDADALWFVRERYRSLAALDDDVADARLELAAINARLRAASNDKLADMDARDGTVHIGIGVTSAGFLFTLVADNIGSFAGSVLGGLTTALAAFAGIAAAAVPATLGILFQIGGGFFNNLVFANENKPLVFDGGISVFVAHTVALAGQSYNEGFTDAALQQYAAEVANGLASTVEYIAMFEVGRLLHMRKPFVDANGVPTESVGGYFLSAGPDAPVDVACGTNDDCDTYPCRHMLDIDRTCPTDQPCVLGICTAVPACTTPDDCGGDRCMGPPPYYDTECTSTHLCAGVCANFCASPIDCISAGAGGTCTNRFTPTDSCGFGAGHACKVGRCYAWPLLVPPNVPTLDLSVNVDPQCDALLGINPVPLQYWVWSTTFQEHGISTAWFFSWDQVRLHWRCWQVGYYVFRYIVARLLNGWRITWAATFLPVVGAMFWFIPGGVFAGAMTLGLSGNVLSSVLGWVQGAFGAVGHFLNGWPWFVGWIGGELVWISDFRPVGTEWLCAVAIISPLSMMAFDILWIGAILALLWSAGVFRWLRHLLCAFGHIFYMCGLVPVLLVRATNAELARERYAAARMRRAPSAKRAIVGALGVTARGTVEMARNWRDVTGPATRRDVLNHYLRDADGKLLVAPREKAD